MIFCHYLTYILCPSSIKCKDKETVYNSESKYGKVLKYVLEMWAKAFFQGASEYESMRCREQWKRCATTQCNLKNSVHTQGIVHCLIANNHTYGLDNGALKSMIGMGGWEVINHHDGWIEYQSVNIGQTSKLVHLFHFIDARGTMK